MATKYKLFFSFGQPNQTFQSYPGLLVSFSLEAPNQNGTVVEREEVQYWLDQMLLLDTSSFLPQKGYIQGESHRIQLNYRQTSLV